MSPTKLVARSGASTRSGTVAQRRPAGAHRPGGGATYLLLTVFVDELSSSAPLSPPTTPATSLLPKPWIARS